MKSQLISIIGAILISATACADSERANLQFDALDVNGDNVLTRVEVESQPDLVVMMNLYGLYGFTLADANGNGVVDRAELQAHEDDLPAE